MMCNGPVSYPESSFGSSIKNLVISALCDVLVVFLCGSVDWADAQTGRQTQTSIVIIHLLTTRSFNLPPLVNFIARPTVVFLIFSQFSSIKSDKS